MTKYVEVIVRLKDKFNVAVQLVDDSRTQDSEVVAEKAFADRDLTSPATRKSIAEVLAAGGIKLTPTMGREINKMARELVWSSKTSMVEVRSITVAMFD